MKKIDKVIIPTAGLGTRMLPITKTIPKEMLPVLKKPIIQYIVEEAIFAGFKEIVFVTNADKKFIESYFNKDFELETSLKQKEKTASLGEIKALSKLNISFQSVRQLEAKGLGHAILCAKKLIGKEHFAVMLPDMLISKENGNAGDSFQLMKTSFEEDETSSILLGEAKKEDIPKYGIAKVKKNSKLHGQEFIEKIVEKPSIKKAPSNLYATGRYIFNNDFFKYLSKVSPDKSQEIQLTNAIDFYIKDNKEIRGFLLDGKIFDCGDNAGYILANLEFAMKDPEIKNKLKNYLKKS